MAGGGGQLKFLDWYLKIAAVSGLVGASMELFMIHTGFCEEAKGVGFSACFRRKQNESRFSTLPRYIEHLTSIRDPGHRRKPTLALGHIIAYALETKYNLQFVVPPNFPPSYFTNNSFHILHSARLHPEHEEAREEEEEDLPDPIPAPVPLRQCSQIDQLVERFDQWEAHFDAFVTQQQ
ncbi:hypothetical protein M5K25_000434 [Dendrobium thyrsiflorum]|uniref:Uncharacterized protein n=1 Tax=Dendrobium thyrsiflorum TaxID=117978 RepID=A0ABD0WB38_DENTH